MKRIRKDKPTMALYPGFVVGGVEFQPTVEFKPTPVLLPLGNCTDPVKCGGRCHYCLTRKYGSDYWQRGVTS